MFLVRSSSSKFYQFSSLFRLSLLLAPSNKNIVGNLSVCLYNVYRDRQRLRQTDRQTETYCSKCLTETDRQRLRQTDRQRHRERQRQKQRETETERHVERERQREAETQRDKEKGTDRKKKKKKKKKKEKAELFCHTRLGSDLVLLGASDFERNAWSLAA